ncbi:hypothetical protein CK203_108316 [Vitis vinifera]|uniref:HMA domain-containing protein n=1 Tax=Vitis vinifera TaxID=29760 RepID=A0A438FFX0_VITVI|nr:hypothetical protein CK203_108316 [Vitis vinifera]
MLDGGENYGLMSSSLLHQIQSKTRATIMVLEDVDLGCKRCHKNIKKLLNKIPDWTFFEKENAVMIKVVSSSPENIKKQLLSEGGETIKEDRVKKIPHAPSCESYSINVIVLVWFLDSFSQLGVESVLSRPVLFSSTTLRLYRPID